MKVEFVEEIPRGLDRDTVYVSMTFAVVAHSCFCGCGHQVVTPLSPRDWKLTFDGEAISLYPSIGNWNLDCKSHYWIRASKIIWADQWSDDRIAAGRERTQKEKNRYYQNQTIGPVAEVITKAMVNTGKKKSWWAQIRSWLSI